MPFERNQLVRDRLERAEKQNTELWEFIRALRSATRDPEVHDRLDSLEERFGGGATERLSLEAIRRGDFTVEQLADRAGELRALLAGQPDRTANGPVTKADLASMSAEDILAMPGGPEAALRIANGGDQ